MNLDRYTEKTALAARIVGTGALLTGLGLVLFGVGTYLTIAESYVFLGGVAWGTSLWESLSLSFTFAVLGIALVSACQVYLETGEVLSAPVIAAAALCIFAEAFFSTLSGGLSIRSFSLWIAAFSALSVSGYVWASSHIRTDILGVLFLILAAALIIIGDSSPVSIVNAFSKARLLNQGVFLSWWYAEVVAFSLLGIFFLWGRRPKTASWLICMAILSYSLGIAIEFLPLFARLGDLVTGDPGSAFNLSFSITRILGAGLFTVGGLSTGIGSIVLILRRSATVAASQPGTSP